MTEAERLPYIQKIQNGDREALTEFWLLHEKLAIKLLGELYRNENNKDDLLQIAFISLWETCKAYQENKDSFIKRWNWKLLRELYIFFGDTYGVKVPSYIKDIQRKIKRLAPDRDGITEKELAKLCDTSVENIRLAMAFMGGTVSLNAPISLADSLENTTLQDTLADEGADFEGDVLDEIERSETWQMVKRELAGQEREAIIKKFLEQKSVDIVAEEMQITPGVVRRLIDKGLKRLKIANGVNELNKRRSELYGSKIYTHNGIKTFNLSFMSSVEWVILENEKAENKLKKKLQAERKREQAYFKKRTNQK